MLSFNIIKRWHKSSSAFLKYKTSSFLFQKAPPALRKLFSLSVFFRPKMALR